MSLQHSCRVLVGFGILCGLSVLASACSKSSSSGGASAQPSASAADTTSASAAPSARTNAGANVPSTYVGSWDHHCDITATRTCIEAAQPDKAECDAAHGTWAPGTCMRAPTLLGTCALATGAAPGTGEPVPQKRILYNLGAGGAMKADEAHTLCNREQLPGAPDATHLWKDGPAARK